MKNAKVSSVYEGKVEEDEEEEAGRSRAARQKARARMRNFKRVYVRAPRPCRRRKRVTRSMARSPSVSPGVVKEKEDEDQNQYMNNNNNNSYFTGMADVKVVENYENFIIDGDELDEYPGADAESVVEVEMEADGEAVIENQGEEKGNNKKVGDKVIIDADDKSSGTEADQAVVEVKVEAGGGGGGGGGSREECKWASGLYDGLDDWPMEWSYEEEWLWMGRGLGLGFSNPQWEYVNGVGWVDKKGPEI